MATSIAQETLVHVFGVRHLSPSGAWHLCRLLDQVRPQLVLIEGLADANDLIPDITRKETHPPIAILAYTQEMPVRTLVYPFAKYSPEYQGLVWAAKNKARAEFIDLPSDIFLALEDRRFQRVLQEAEKRAQQLAEEEAAQRQAPDGRDASDDSDQNANAAAPPAAGQPPPLAEAELATTLAGHLEEQGSFYDQFARMAGEDNYETYWERRFEHNLSVDAYRLAAFEFGKGLRALETAADERHAENLVREAYMRRRIHQAIQSGIPPHKIVAIVGAFHAPVLTAAEPPMSDAELASLPRRQSKLTLMPYSYFKLSSQSGYGAGNQAPAYFQLLWDCLQQDDLPELPSKYLSLVARQMRAAGTHRSTAEVIEGVRLACTLSAMKSGSAPTLADLQDAAITLIGHGERSNVQEALARVEVGTAIGQLPKGVSQTSIQDDFNREIERLKLGKYLATTKQELGLDLRENRRVKSESAAFLDLDRSSFLHRLRVLEISFGEPVASGQQSATWAEKWTLQWSPEVEICLVEAVLLGETVELATAYKFKTLLEKCTSIDAAAKLVHDACQAAMMHSMDLARQRVQQLAAGSSDFVPVALAARQLGLVVRYGDVRQFDPAPLVPLIQDLFVQGALALLPASNCDNAAARQAQAAMDALDKVALEYHDKVDEPLWFAKLKTLADLDDRNPLLSGYACAILLERGLATNEELSKEVSRRLSPGISADLGAGWFEGLAMRNRYALLARQPLWQQLADYVASLDEEQFRRAIVFLRRAFGSFSMQEKRQIAENLGEHWGLNKDLSSELMEQPMTEKEQQALDDLKDFDFGDL